MDNVPTTPTNIPPANGPMTTPVKVRQPLSSVGSALGKALSFYGANFSTVFCIAVLPILGSILYNWYKMTGSDQSLLLPILLFVSLVLQYIAVLAFFELVTSSSPSCREAYQGGFRNFFAVIWIAIINSLAILGGFVLFVIPSIMLGTWLVFTTLILFKEQKAGLVASATSRDYVRDYGWAVFGRLVVMVIIAAIATVVIDAFVQGLTASFYLTASFQTLLNYLVILPIEFAFLNTIYTELREIKLGEANSFPTDKAKSLVRGYAIFGLIVILLVGCAGLYLVLRQWQTTDVVVKDINPSLQSVTSSTDASSTPPLPAISTISIKKTSAQQLIKLP